MNKDWTYTMPHCKYCGAPAESCTCQKVPLLAEPEEQEEHLVDGEDYHTDE